MRARLRRLVRGTQRWLEGFRPRRFCAAAGTLPALGWQRREQLLAALQEILDRHGIEHRSFAAEGWVACALEATQAARLPEALHQLERERNWQLQLRLDVDGQYRAPQPAVAISASLVQAAKALRVEVPYRFDDYRVEEEGGVELLLLDRQDARLVARRRRALKADWTDDFNASSGEAAPRHRFHLLDDEPIDVVYTWVDSSDPQWRQDFERHAADADNALPEGGSDERFLDRDELKYSLRSLWMYAPFVRNIYIVTSGQVPEWLDVSRPNVRLVTHAEIFPDDAMLPTFNSHAIEACLHRIPGLSEHFLYFNDDVFLGREVTRESFYTRAGLIKSRFAPSSFAANARPGADAIPTDWASFNAVEAVYRECGLRFDRKHKHAPMPMKRSLLEDIEQRFSELVEATRKARFRSRTDISMVSMFAHYYGIATRRAVEWEGVAGEVMYADTGRADFPHKLEQIRQRSPAFFCLNVTRYRELPPARQAALLREFLETRYPLPSPLEKRQERR